MARGFKNKNISLLFFVIAALVLFIGSQNSAWAQFGFAKTNEVGDASMLRYYAINVGQGDCTYFAFPNGQNMLVDAGAKKSWNAINAFLKEHNVKKIDLLVATHPHSDHIGSICNVIRKYDIGEVWDDGYIHGSDYQRDYYKAVKAKGVPFKVVSAGYERDFGDVHINVLAPVRIISGTKSDANNNSIVMLVTYKDVSFFMTGDMERAERDTFTMPRATVLKAAHHGSKDGTNNWLLSRVRPQIITLSYAIGNDYGHPHKQAVDSINNFRLTRFDTPDGTICIATDGKQVIYNKKQVVKND